MSLLVVDGASLIGLDRIGRCELLTQVFPRVIAPAAVHAELGKSPDWLTIVPGCAFMHVAVNTVRFGDGAYDRMWEFLIERLMFST